MYETDYELLIEMFLQLSPATLKNRFIHPHLEINAEIAHAYVSRFWAGRAEQEYMVLATVRDNNRERVIAVAELLHSGDPADPAEIALLVVDDYQREGIGSKLILDLEQEAKARGITHWRADASGGNEAVQQLAKKSGRLYKAITRYGETEMWGNL
jgi:GNAT superfamily N-acetyltransferase